MPKRLPSIVLVVLCALASCGGEDVAWRPVAEAELSDAQKRQQTRAFETRDALVGRLMKRLMAAMGEGGAPAAIAACQAEAPAIARDLTRETGVEIGRTSFRRRNPQNVPPSWAAPFVQKRVEEAVYLEDDTGRLAALLPIRLMQTCLTCHGPEEKIPEDVLGAIRRAYPDDEATGFERGDLRGYVWLVVPKP